MAGSVALGIDTSNYKTSVAAVDSDGCIVCNLQKYLDVKKGERGLRQSVALFQHVNNLPDLITELFQQIGTSVPCCVAVSSRPRPVEGSYMPVFNAGVSAAEMIAAAINVPCYKFSHQEGHIEAVRHNSPMAKAERFISFHFSGGTTEALLVDHGSISIIGGTKDIAFGQLIDRLGVASGMDFPAGAEMDSIAIACREPAPKDVLPPIKVIKGYFNLSGIETSALRSLDDMPRDLLIKALFDRIGETIVKTVRQTAEEYDIDKFLFAGGVSSSDYIRNYINDAKPLKNIKICFGDPALSTDNAAGTAYLGGKMIWR
jgi:Metal-dependent proteases with possible chaperone activity